jgi:hypothetical protein
MQKTNSPSTPDRLEPAVARAIAVNGANYFASSSDVRPPGRRAERFDLRSAGSTILKNVEPAQALKGLSA